VAELSCQVSEHERLRNSGFSLRRVNWVERNIRMLSRVLWTLGDLSMDGWREVGPSLLRNTIVNLPFAYRLATRHGPKLQAKPYPGWSVRFNALRDRDRVGIVGDIARLASRLTFHILLAGNGSDPNAIRATLVSLDRQLYRNFTCTVLDTDGAADESLNPDSQSGPAAQRPRVVPQEMISNWLAAFNDSLGGEQAGHWTMLLRAGDVLAEHALYWFAREISERSDGAILYSDDDALDAGGQPYQYRFKPDWSLAHLRSTNYVGDAVVLRGGAVAAAGGLTADCLRYGSYDLLLRAIDAVGEKVVHIPAVLLHRRAQAQVHTTPRDVPLTLALSPTGGEGILPLTLALSPKGGEGDLEVTSGYKDPGTLRTTVEDAWEEPRWCVEKVREHLRRRGVEAEVTDTRPGCRWVRYPLPGNPPLVSIIVPTRDALPLLRQCVESVLGKTKYPRFELLVVDNQSADPEALAYLGELARRATVRVIRYDRPFNYSAINNFAARQAQGEVLCLLNNDTEVISPDWLEEMVGHLLQDKVGAVGARLLYTDGRVQHGGVTVGPGGCADHLHAELPRGHPGYCHRAVIAQELSAVTAACMLTWKHLYERLGGFDEKNLPVAFNDVDYCLRLQDAGYRVIYTPHAELYHHEWATRGVDATWRQRWRARREINYMRLRWRERMKHDPYYNPNLSYDQPNFTLNWKPRVKKPWER
jgi:GT2 family glycosyltransferase